MTLGSPLPPPQRRLQLLLLLLLLLLFSQPLPPSSLPSTSPSNDTPDKVSSPIEVAAAAAAHYHSAILLSRIWMTYWGIDQATALNTATCFDPSIFALYFSSELDTYGNIQAGGETIPRAGPRGHSLSRRRVPTTYILHTARVARLSFGRVRRMRSVVVASTFCHRRKKHSEKSD